MKETKRRAKIAVILLGGTIVSRYDSSSGHIAPDCGVRELLALVPDLYREFDIRAYELCNIPGSLLTPEHGLKLAGMLERVLADPEVDGAVVIQGSDTLDEISYLISLLVDSGKPVIFTAAMKSRNELYQDAAGNIRGAVQIAASPRAGEWKALVYMNQLLFDAKDVEKSHSGRTDAFQSFRGPVGAVEGGKLSIWRRPVPCRSFRVDSLVSGIPIIKCYAGMDSLFLDISISAGCPGIVIEGLGNGNVQPVLIPGLKRALDAGVAVAVATRCFSGTVFGSYSYEGGGAELEKMGVIFTDGLSSQKARIKLSVLLSAGFSREETASLFRE